MYGLAPYLQMRSWFFARQEKGINVIEVKLISHGLLGQSRCISRSFRLHVEMGSELFIETISSRDIGKQKKEYDDVSEEVVQR
jgi:hypothetical protein